MGNASRRYIQALNRAGHHVSIRPIYNAFCPYPESEIEKEILDLEKNSSTSYHTCIQHCYPHQMQYNNKVGKTIGLIHLESYNYANDMAQYFRLVDEIIVGSKTCRDAIVGAGVSDKPLHIVPEPIDLDFFGSFRELNEKKSDGFTFYSLGDFSTRKNMLTTMLAHAIICSRYDYVNLIIKTKNKNLAEHIISNSHIKESIEINNTVFPISKDHERQPRIIVGNTEYKNILHLHNRGDCLVSISSGESFGYPSLEALAFDNNIIVSENTGVEDLLDDGFGLLVSSTTVPCEENHKPYFMYNTVFQEWQKPDLHDLVRKMEMAILENESDKVKRIEKQRAKLKRCSMDSVADMLRGL